VTGQEDTLHVRRHLVRSRVAAGGRAPAVGSAVQRLVVDRLAGVALPAPDDHGVWLIRRLDVTVPVGAAWAPSWIARTLAAGTARALAQAIERGADGERVVFFPDRAAFLARFLVDCADGRAAGRWEYEEFASDRADPSAALQAMIERKPSSALEALAGLAERDLRHVVDRLAPADADAVLGALAAATAPGADDPAPLVVAALARLLDRSALQEEAQAAGLTLFLEVARRQAFPPPTGTEARAREVARLRAIVLAASPDERKELAPAIAEGRWASAGARVARALPEVVAWPAAARREAVRVLVAAGSGEPERTGEPRSSPLATSLGGMFLFLPLLDELPWDAMTAGWPELDGVAPSQLAQFLAVAGALGADRNPATALDAVLRLALGVPTGVGASAINSWSRRIGRDATERSAEALIARLSGDVKVSGAVTVAPLGGDRVVAIDGARGVWLGIAPAAPASIRGLVESVEAGLGRPAAVAGSESWIEACLPPGRPQPDPIDGRLLFRLGPQARYATLGEPFELSPGVTDLFLVAAQALGRELAWRLPGFSRSTLPYLSDNVLQFEASVDVDPGRYVVRVGDPPLHLLLSLAGMNRSRFHLEATGDREWVLTQER